MSAGEGSIVLKQDFDSLRGEEFDFIIVGGGITGAAIAYELSLLGFSAALFEKGDFGGGTSSRSSKLIHGGYRYLKNGRVFLVCEALRERKFFCERAPNFVHRIPTILAHFDRKNKYLHYLGAPLYNCLSYDKELARDKSKRMPRYKQLSAEQALKFEPGIKTGDLIGATRYYDCINIFPERLTLSFIKSAASLGARVFNYTEAKNILLSKDKKRVCGVLVKNLIMGREFEIKGRAVINCGGPWADNIDRLALKKKDGEPIIRSAGIHIITRSFVDKNIIAALTPDRRYIFGIPWRGHTLWGTTEEVFLGNPDEYSITRAGILKFLGEISGAFDVGRLSISDVLHAYGGLRPLVETQSENTLKASRKFEIYDHARGGLEGFITVTGGKYTTSRALAEKAAKIAVKKIGRPYRNPHSEKLFLYGSEIEDMCSFMSGLLGRYGHDFSLETIRYLGMNYGQESHEIFKLACDDPELAEIINADGEILAEVVYAAKNEMAEHLVPDILLHRTGIGTLGNPGDKILRRTAYIAGRALKWNLKRIAKEAVRAKNYFNLPGKQPGTRRG